MFGGKGWVAIDEDDEYSALKTRTTEGRIHGSKVRFYMARVHNYIYMNAHWRTSHI
jgi:hypothetical protein